MKKLLPLTEPVSNCYQGSAFPLSVMGLHSGFKHWYVDKLIQLACPKELDEHVDINFFDIDEICEVNSFMIKRRIQRALLKKFNISLIDFIIETINMNNYVYLFVDDYYLSEKSYFYKKRHHDHDIFICGYDSNEQYFNLFGYYGDGIFGNFKASFSEIVQGFENVQFESWRFQSHCDDIVLYQAIKDNQQNENSNSFEYSSLKIMLEEYVESKDSSHKGGIRCNKIHCSEFIYGVAIYDQFIALIDRKKTALEKLDIRDYHLLYEHKKLMSFRLEYLFERDFLQERDIINEYREIEKKSVILKNVVLKYNITRKISDIEKIKDLVMNLKVKESMILHSVISNLI
ncbi:hypothetical protein Back11_39490 [Paenibacillus baekrokdamisoli]|uniref:Uncharacterized protein n=1 Tax=Paenibacillus baekrokdamisoli TaxID=1712516 RepID=A0A3G9JHV3_9BACL|nr:hypothetical protein [Paenibacillus baekrokdamisoli]MBB3068354.1 hypothetical protein [Paenibacillus baekrokdamisoli]BBH22604.1 hypothetical protein Back11_39490 [Paenibacillus baekrokdamisoli]